MKTFRSQNKPAHFTTTLSSSRNSTEMFRFVSRSLRSDMDHACAAQLRQLQFQLSSTEGVCKTKTKNPRKELFFLYKDVVYGVSISGTKHVGDYFVRKKKHLEKNTLLTQYSRFFFKILKIFNIFTLTLKNIIN